MITKQDLEDYRFRETAIEQQFEKLKLWQNKLNRINTSYGFVSKTAPAEYQTVSSNIQGIINKTLADIQEMSERYKEIDSLINRIPDPKIRAVMQQYYVLCAVDWDDVAAVLDLSRRTVHRLHGYGLEIIKRIQADEQK